MKTRALSIGLVTSCLGVLAACGGGVEQGSGGSTSGTGAGAGAGTGGSGSGTWVDGCKAADARDTKCNGSSDPGKLASCEALAPCVDDVFRADLAGPIQSCLANRACGASEDACYSTQGIGATPSQAFASFSSGCLSRRTACESDPAGSFGDDTCYADVVSDALAGKLAACLSQGCGDIASCFKDTVNAAVAACPGANL